MEAKKEKRIQFKKLNLPFCPFFLNFKNDGLMKSNLY
jgi:hypothetical protein